MQNNKKAVATLLSEISKYAQRVKQNYAINMLDRDYSRVVSVPNYSLKLAQHLVISEQLSSRDPVEAAFRQAILSGWIRDSQTLADYVHCHPHMEQILQLLMKPLRFQPATVKARELQRLSGVFVPLNIKDWILQHSVHLYRYQLEINGLFVKLQLYRSETLSTEAETKVINEVALAVAVVTQSYEISDTQTIDITYFMTNSPKVLASKTSRCNSLRPELRQQLRQLGNIGNSKGPLRFNGKYITRNISVSEVNSALCNLTPGRQYIVIWRNEEFVKVLMHELIHFYRLEKVRLPDLGRLLRLNASNTFEANPIELITESQTWFLHLVVLYLRSGSSQRRLAEIVSTEQQYALDKAADILKYCGITNWSQFYGGDDPKYTLNVNCSMVYYYLLKALWVSSIDNQMLNLVVPHYELTNPRHVTKRLKQLSTMAKPHFNLMLRNKPRYHPSLKMTYFGE